MNKSYLLVLPLAVGISACSSSIYTTKSAYNSEDHLGFPYYKSATPMINVAIERTDPDAGKADKNANKPDADAGKSASKAKKTTPKAPSTASSNAHSATIKTTAATLNVPKHRAYLYLNESGWYGNNIDIKSSNFGQLKSSDGKSNQEVTSLLTDFGRTVGQAAQEAAALAKTGVLFMDGKNKEAPKEIPECDISKLRSGFYSFNLAGNEKTIIAKNVDNSLSIIKIDVEGDLSTPSDSQCINTAQETDGICVSEPNPVVVKLKCDGQLLTSPLLVNTYVSHVKNPERNFFTNRHETYTFNDGGLLVEQKYENQSYAKGIFDLLLALPKGIIGVLPMPQTQSTTQVITVPGEPTKTTDTVQTTLTPPKQ